MINFAKIINIKKTQIYFTQIEKNMQRIICCDMAAGCRIQIGIVIFLEIIMCEV